MKYTNANTDSIYVAFIAEVSSNHARDLNRCYEFIKTAANIGCYGIKFQLFQIEKLFSKEILNVSEKHRERKNWELPVEFIPKIAECCNEFNIRFICTPFYIEAVEIVEEFVAYLKISSYELLWDELLSVCAHSGKPVIISTGMATMKEIEHAVEVLKQGNCSEIILLHCNSSYPSPANESNLSAIDTMRNKTGCKMGWSDHTVQPAVIHRAIHRWNAEMIEFHLDLDGQGEEYQAGHCWLPEQIAPVIEQTRIALMVDGDGVKKPMPAELADRDWRADPADGLRPLMHIRKSFNS